VSEPGRDTDSTVLATTENSRKGGVSTVLTGRSAPFVIRSHRHHYIVLIVEYLLKPVSLNT